MSNWQPMDREPAAEDLNEHGCVWVTDGVSKAVCKAKLLHKMVGAISWHPMPARHPPPLPEDKT